MESWSLRLCRAGAQHRCERSVICEHKRYRSLPNGQPVAARAPAKLLDRNVKVAQVVAAASRGTLADIQTTQEFGYDAGIT